MELQNVTRFRGGSLGGSTRSANSVICPDMAGPYYQPQERRTEQLSARIPLRLKVALEAVVRLWSIVEKIEHGEEAGSTTLADAINRLLEVGVEGSFGELGFQDIPKSEREWAEVEDRLRKDRANGKPK